jgi:hypothetical protein
LPKPNEPIHCHPESAARPNSRAEKSGGFYQRVVMQALERMTLGCLHLELPDGTKKIIGQPDAKISASVRI